MKIKSSEILVAEAFDQVETIDSNEAYEMLQKNESN